MGEADYQMALLLQHQFEQEYKSARQPQNSDFHLAVELQQQFEREIAIEKPKGNLVYESKNEVSETLNSSKCLVDPSWEVIDPTPDVHVLFVAFSQRFFWNKLATVCVSWSKRMTSCAGICSYQGRGGMCHITLSEPLLKLRPRKDLVQTLLHEMIHAYLFVTNNNRDRDGHGPEFLKHMYRINKESGTNITVYHDFHDEVRLYQQHWWRCNGPCNTRRPYFGMVRRATNRAPGPNDRWWENHSRTCGGSFIKVKEPEKLQKKTSISKTKKDVNPNNSINDICNYLPNSASTTNGNKGKSNSKHPVFNNTSINSPVQIGSVIPSTNNIFGFSNLNGNSSSKPSMGRPNGVSNIRGGIKNSSNTIVINKKPSTITSESEKTPTKVESVPVFTGNGHALLDKSSWPGSKTDYSVVRNHWLNKFSSNDTKRYVPESQDSSPKKIPNKAAAPSMNDRKRYVPESQRNSPPKNPNYAAAPSMNDRKRHVPELQDNSPKKVPNNAAAPSMNDKKRYVPESQCSSTKKIPKMCNNDAAPSSVYEANANCPVCNKYVQLNLLNDHLDKCLSAAKDDDLTKCIICDTKLSSKQMNEHMIKCSQKHFADDVFEDDTFKKCHVCQKQIPAVAFDEHLKSCKSSSVIDLTSNDEKLCLVCNNFVKADIYNRHAEKCLLKLYDEMENKYQDQRTNCLACRKEILKTELDSHLEECMNMSNVFDTSNVPVEDDCDFKADKKYNCPICMKLVLDSDMNGHLDVCLNSIDDTSKEEILCDF